MTLSEAIKTSRRTTSSASVGFPICSAHQNANRTQAHLADLQKKSTNRKARTANTPGRQHKMQGLAMIRCGGDRIHGECRAKRDKRALVRQCKLHFLVE